MIDPVILSEAKDLDDHDLSISEVIKQPCTAPAGHLFLTVFMMSAILENYSRNKLSRFKFQGLNKPHERSY